MQKFFLLSILLAAVACDNSESKSDGCGCGDDAGPAMKTGGCGDAPTTDGCGGEDTPAKTDPAADAGKEIVLNVTGMT